MRYFLIDRVKKIIPGEIAEGVKNITLSEDYLQDHFPGAPVFPGCLMIESVAQLAGFLLEVTVNQENFVRRAVLGQVDKAKFHDLVHPGDQIKISCKLQSLLPDAAQVSGVCFVEDKKISSMRLNLVMKQIDSLEIHQKRRELYQIWTYGLDLNFPIL